MKINSQNLLTSKTKMLYCNKTHKCHKTRITHKSLKKPKTHKLSEFVTTGKAAELCSVTPDSVLKWIKAGKLPASRTPGGHYRIRRSDLDIIVQPNIVSIGVKKTNPRSFQYCWEFNSASGELKDGCQSCVVYKSRALRCYEMSTLPDDAGHAKLYCDESCDECEYYHLVKEQPLNVLVVSDKQTMRDVIGAGMRDTDVNIQYTDCEYKCSMVVENYRPDYGIIDCSMGVERARDFVHNLYADPRIPFIRIILVGERTSFPRECDKETFAYVETPLDLPKLKEFFVSLTDTSLREIKSADISRFAHVSSI